MSSCILLQQSKILLLFLVIHLLADSQYDIDQVRRLKDSIVVMDVHQSERGCKASLGQCIFKLQNLSERHQGVVFRVDECEFEIGHVRAV